MEESKMRVSNNDTEGDGLHDDRPLSEAISFVSESKIEAIQQDNVQESNTSQEEQEDSFAADVQMDHSE